jgi:exonuclease VII large subunit
MTHKSLVHAVHQKLYSLNKKLETLKPHRSLVKLGHKYSGYRKSLEDSKIDAHSFYTLKLAPLKLDLDDFQRKSVNTMQSKMNHYGLRLERSRIKIFNSDPKAILKKGYAMAMDKDHRIIRNRKEMLKAKKPLSLEFHDGRINFTIEGSK